MKQTEQETERAAETSQPVSPVHAHRPDIDALFDAEQDGLDPDLSADPAPKPLSPASRRRILIAIAVLITLGLLAVLPPLVNVNRYRRRIATSISASLGRPVHLDSVTLTLLPTPGFVLTNFVVDEDPAFGAEPVIRANTVRATLRIRSLWQRKVEFSRISLVEPSLNLVHAPAGQWNIESILVQASRMPVIPTEATHDEHLQRFPYIEATGARVNFKDGLEKKPFALTDAEFALWLPEPGRWRVRLEAHPARTDTAAADTGLLKLEGTLGKAPTLGEVPVDLTAAWQAAPLGAASWVLVGRDAGLRGEMTLRAHLAGTLGTSSLTTRLELRRLRRADFVPPRSLDVDLACQAEAHDALHRFEHLACAWPAANGTGGFSVTGRLADVRHPITSAAIDARWTNVSAAGLLDVLRIATDHIAPDLHAAGTISGDLHCCEQGLPNASGTASSNNLRVALNGAKPFLDHAGLHGSLRAETLTLDPLPLDLGAAQPAMLTLAADRTALHLLLTGPALRARLADLAQALPPFGEGIDTVLPATPAPAAPGPAAPESPIRLNLTAIRPWGAPQIWTEAIPPRTKPKSRRHPRR